MKGPNTYCSNYIHVHQLLCSGCNVNALVALHMCVLKVVGLVCTCLQVLAWQQGPCSFATTQESLLLQVEVWPSI